VADGVERGAGLAFGGARAGGMGGVQAIGLELFVSGIKTPLNSRRAGADWVEAPWKLVCLLAGMEIDCGMGRHCEMYSRGKLGRGDWSEGSGKAGGYAAGSK